MLHDGLLPWGCPGLAGIASVGRTARGCHTATRGWFFDQFEQWCATGMTRPWGRVLVVRGPDGIGKSTLAAALCCQSGGKVRADPGTVFVCQGHGAWLTEDG